MLRSGMKIYDTLPCASCITNVNGTTKVEASIQQKHGKCLQMITVRIPGIDEPLFISACRECDGLVNE